MKKTWKVFVVGLVLVLLLAGCDIATVEAASKYCTAGTAVKYVANRLGLRSAGSGYEGYRDALIDAGILQEGELAKLSRYITREQAALLCGRIMDFLGEEEDTVQVDRILKYGRISDMDKVDEELKRAVARVYGAGIIVGTSDGKYTQSRTFKPAGKIRQSGFRNVVQMAMGKMERKQMSPDGQLIRTTKLPFNACEYDYVLASFPNEFYQIKFGYELSYYNHMPVSPKDYAAPVDVKKRNAGEMIEEWKYEWADIIKKNYELKLNFDYRTVDDTWVEELAKTYNSAFDEEKNAEQIKKIKEWVRWAKKNELIIENEITSVEPSSFYHQNGLNVSAYVKFRVKSCKNFEQNKNKIIFARTVKLDDVKYNTWYGGVIESGISWYSLTPTGDTAGLSVSDAFCPGLEKIDLLRKTGLMKPVKLSDKEYSFDYIK